MTASLRDESIRELLDVACERQLTSYHASSTSSSIPTRAEQLESPAAQRICCKKKLRELLDVAREEMVPPCAALSAPSVRTPDPL